MDEQERRELGPKVEAARKAHGWGKEEAGRRAGISSITWKRIEDGLTVQDAKLVPALRVVGLSAEPASPRMSDDDLRRAIESAPFLSDRDKRLLILQLDAMVDRRAETG